MQDFVNKNLIYKTIVGSTAYGLNTPESDIDIKGITIAPKEYYFGLKVFEQQEIGKDQVIYAINKFVKLARNANPNIIEMLYTDPKHILFMNKYGERLRDNRDLFLSQRAMYTFSGYAFAQLKRIKNHRKWIMFKEEEPKPEDFIMQKTRKDSQGNTITYNHFREYEYKDVLKKWNQYLKWKRDRNPDRAKLEEKFGYDCKHAMHLMRLLSMGKELLSSGQVHVLRPDREKLLDIRNGKWSYEAVVAVAEAMDIELKEIAKTSPLPHSPNDKAIDKLLIEITEEALNDKYISYKKA